MYDSIIKFIFEFLFCGTKQKNTSKILNGFIIEYKYISSAG